MSSFRKAPLFDQVCWSPLPLHNTPYSKFSLVFSSNELANQSTTHDQQTIWFWHYGQALIPAGKGSQHHHKTCQRIEAWSALKSPDSYVILDLIKHRSPAATPAHCSTYTQYIKNLGFCVSLRPWFPIVMQNLLLSVKRTSDQQSSSFTP